MRRSALLSITLILLLLSSGAWAQTAATGSEASASATKAGGPKAETSAGPRGQQAATSRAATNGQQAQSSEIQLREPTREETRVLLEGMKSYVNDSAEGLTVVKHPDGRLSMDHEGRFQSVVVAKRNADGTVSTECATSLEQVRQFLEKQKMGDATAGRSKSRTVSDKSGTSQDQADRQSNTDTSQSRSETTPGAKQQKAKSSQPSPAVAPAKLEEK
jgi:hypothetical protein